MEHKNRQFMRTTKNTSSLSKASQAAWSKLQSLALDIDNIRIEEQLDIPGKLEELSVDLGELYVDLSKNAVTSQILQQLLVLAEESEVLEKAHQMISGEHLNTSEDRPAMHMGLRNPKPPTPIEFINKVNEELEIVEEISSKIRNGTWTGSSGKAITDVINIGIGGSDIGPKMVVTALREFHDGPRLHFISNVDGSEILSLIATLEAATTLVVISSKSFTTAETILNAKTAFAWLKDELGLAKPQNTSHCFAITSDREKAQALGIPDRQILTFPDSIGGRYSVWSSVGFSICVATGFVNFKSFLAGGAKIDDHFLNAPPEKNIPLLMGLLGIWYNNFLKAQTHAVIPYCERLGLFVDYLQQLDMESSGKSSARNGEFTEVDTGPVIWGKTGTNGQHAFFQLLHQGTKLVSVDFIGTVNDKLSRPEHHRLLLANMIAQSAALMTGQANKSPHRRYPGNRPSSTLLLDQVNPKSLGMLIALYEHKVFVQGAIWAINSFDQWGVELGKELTNNILDGSKKHDSSTLTLLRKTGLTA